MSDEGWDGLEPEGEPSAEEVAATSGFGDLPKATQEELKKRRKAEESLRASLHERENEVLAAKYRPEVLDLIPPEVTDFARRTELAERYQTALATSLSTGSQAEAEAPEAAPEPPTEAERTLATATGGPATGTSNLGVEYTPKEIRKIGQKDPARAEEIIRQMDPEVFKREFGLPK